MGRLKGQKIIHSKFTIKIQSLHAIVDEWEITRGIGGTSNITIIVINIKRERTTKTISLIRIVMLGKQPKIRAKL